MGDEGLGRRRLLLGATGGASTLVPRSHARAVHGGWLASLFGSVELIDQQVQALITPDWAQGRQYTDADVSRHFKSNGTHYPRDLEYRLLAKTRFVDWRLELTGLVDHPMRLSLAQIRALPAVTQITRHDCVEGWSCIGKWTGVPLRVLLSLVGVQRSARYVVFRCYDTVGTATERYYESIDIAEAAFPDTILAYGMNNRMLPIPYGAPLRLRLGRQLGYKMPKYLYRLELVEGFRHIEGGHGGFYEDHGYAWYAGI